MTGPAGTGLKTIWVAATAAILLAAVAGAWILERARSSESESALASYVVTVSYNGEKLASYGFVDFQAMPQSTVTMDGQPQTGPRLIYVLEDAGITQFDRVTVRGMGARDDGVLELTADQVDEELLLDLANRGTVKLAGPDISRADRVRDVISIEAQ